MAKIDGSIVKREQGEHISLRSQYFEFLDIDLDQYRDVDYTKEEAIAIKRRMQHLLTGAAAALPLTCKGPQCPFAVKCPFVAIDKQRQSYYEEKVKEGLGQFVERPRFETPVGKACLVEVNLMNEWTRIYVEEFDAVTFVDLGMCRELAEIEVMLWRINNGLAKEENAQLMQQTVVGADKQGNPLVRLENHNLLDAKEKQLNRKSKLIKLMVGDRQEKYKKESALKQRDEKDPSSSAAQLRVQITRLVKEAGERVLKLAELEGNVIDAVSEPQKSLPETITPESLIDSEGQEE